MSFFLALAGCIDPTYNVEQQVEAPAPALPQKTAIDTAKTQDSSVLEDGCSFYVQRGNVYQKSSNPGYSNDPEWPFCSAKLNAFRQSVIEQLSPTHEIKCERTKNIAMDGETVTLIESCKTVKK